VQHRRAGGQRIDFDRCVVDRRQAYKWYADGPIDAFASIAACSEWRHVRDHSRGFADLQVDGRIIELHRDRAHRERISTLTSRHNYYAQQKRRILHDHPLNRFAWLIG
jgi:hypothetical protein